MENHPIPQNVTGFQFKLIGDMTIKQFAYLAAGVISGWFFFSLPITAFITFPISVFFVLTGISFAFIPIDGRPIDVMVANFIKSLFNPTLYIYRKTDHGTLLSNIYPPIIKSHAPTPHVISTGKNPIDQLKKEKENESLPKKEKALEKELEDAKTKEEKQDEKPSPSPSLHQKVLSLEKQLQEILAQKEQLAQQIVDLQKKLNLQKQTTLTPVQNVRHAPKNIEKTVSLPTPDDPNIIIGIVTDPRGNPLSNILVEIKDKEGNPVRAFKTSVLGQFASATPLSNGVYRIELEDPKKQNKFDALELSVTGQIIMPFVVKSIDQREELRKSLFGQQTN